MSNLEEAGQLEGENEEAFAMRLMKARMSGPSAEALAALQPHEVIYEDDDTKEACMRNPQLKLLMRLIKWENRESDERTHLIWTIPASLAPNDLLSYVRIIDHFLLEPFMPQDQEKGLDDFVRKEYKRKPRRMRSESPASAAGGNGGASDDDAALFSDPEAAAAIRGARKLKKAGSSKKGKGRGRHEGGAEEEGKATKRRKKRVEEAKKYRTAEFILDSDDDEEGNRLFFEREEALRKEMEARSGGNAVVDGSGKPAAKATKKQKKAAEKLKKAKSRKSRGKERATSATEEPDSDAGSANSDENVWTSPSEAEEAALAKPRSPKARPRPRPTVKAIVADPESDADEGSSPPANSSLKRTRPITSDAESEDEEESSPKMTAAAASKKGRLVVDSDED